jgi:hypothetical protein
MVDERSKPMGERIRNNEDVRTITELMKRIEELERSTKVRV